MEETPRSREVWFANAARSAGVAAVDAIGMILIKQHDITFVRDSGDPGRQISAGPLEVTDRAWTRVAADLAKIFRVLLARSAIRHRIDWAADVDR